MCVTPAVNLAKIFVMASKRHFDFDEPLKSHSLVTWSEANILKLDPVLIPIALRIHYFPNASIFVKVHSNILASSFRRYFEKKCSQVMWG